ncbi:hypothetical protein O181_028785 [Austropuccinia psidii MF-1]|uniref:Uncharacterized protein n=1 Tax=Austropuccinia psidii MF-1 TaxID=1389203 RepID=A0A9Q3H4J6_9BASI|nr:hypothetical protein [Austropuccinia psidii MF-1]
MSDHAIGDYMIKTATTTTSHRALISSLPNSKSHDLDKCESLENKAGRLEQECQCDAKERDECAPRLKAKLSDKSKNLVEDKTSKLTPDKIGWGNLENNEQAHKTATPDARTRVITQYLQPYQPANFDPKNQRSMLTVWLGYIPTIYVDTLQTMIRTPPSLFYTNANPLWRALAKTVNPSLPILSFATKTTAIIASVTTCAAAILAIGIVVVARQSRRSLACDHGQIGLNSKNNGLQIAKVADLPSNQIITPSTISNHSGHMLDPFTSSTINPIPSTSVRLEYGQAKTTSISASQPNHQIGNHSANILCKLVQETTQRKPPPLQNSNCMLDSDP